MKAIAHNSMNTTTAAIEVAIQNALGGEPAMRQCRKPQIVADAAYALFQKDAKSFSGNFLIDDSFLAGEGVSDFEQYRVDPSQALLPDFFVPDSAPLPPGVSLSPRI